VCAGNSAHSILGEVILNIPGAGRDAAFSAKSQPKGAVHPGALRLLARRGIDSAGLHSSPS
jgi:arsenate reductase